jgi:putative hemolysin
MTLVIQSIILLCIIAVNAFLALSEMALVSARKTRLQKLADDGSRGAYVALRLAESPTGFLASLQICITILGIAAGAYGGAHLSEPVEGWIIAAAPSLESWASGLGVGFVVAVETFLMVLLGELLPKRMALFFPEKIAVTVAPVIAGLGRVISPASNLLSGVTDQLIKTFRLRPANGDEGTVTEDEIKIMVEQGATEGVFDKTEESLLKRALDFSDMAGYDLMTPRTRVVSFSANDTIESTIDRMLKEGFSHFPVYQDARETIIGVVSIKRVYAYLRKNQSMKLFEIMSQPVFVPDSAKSSRIIEIMQSKRQHFVVLIDEFGGFAGIITATDLMEAVVGEFPGGHKGDTPKFVQRVDGSWLVDGMVSLYELENELGLVAGSDVEADFQTLSGLVMHYLDSIPREGQFIEIPGWRLEVVDMDRNRIDKVLISKFHDSRDVKSEDGDENTRS